jgi:hypothetical protein
VVGKGRTGAMRPDGKQESQTSFSMNANEMKNPLTFIFNNGR